MMIAHSAVQYVGVESMLHMTCVGSTKENVSGYLEKAKGLGLRNILALRGDLPNIDEEWQYDPEKFNYGTDLVRHIRQTTGDYFTICVAGCHPKLKPSVDAGDSKPRKNCECRPGYYLIVLIPPQCHNSSFAICEL